MSRPYITCISYRAAVYLSGPLLPVPSNCHNVSCSHRHNMHLSHLSPDYPTLHDVCHKYPAIDNHAHPLLKLAHRDAKSFENVISDASGAALEDSVYSLACFRATRQLAKLFDLKGEDVTWDQVKVAGREMEYQKLCRTCFEPARIQCILIDDGLGGSKDLAEGYKWHDWLTTSPTKRIVRFETSAEVFSSPTR